MGLGIDPDRLGPPEHRWSEMQLTGVVKCYFPDKGYGFIKPSDGSPDAFVHATAVRAAGLEELKKDDRVSFDVGPGPNGKPRASAISLLAA